MYALTSIFNSRDLLLKQGMAKCVQKLNRLISSIKAHKYNCHLKIRQDYCLQCQKGTIEGKAWLPFPKKKLATKWAVPILKKKIISGKHWHVEHFVCAKCEKPFLGNRHYERKGLAYCETHYHQLFGNLCYVCNQVIQGDVFTALNKAW